MKSNDQFLDDQTESSALSIFSEYAHQEITYSLVGSQNYGTLAQSHGNAQYRENMDVYLVNPDQVLRITAVKLKDIIEYHYLQNTPESFTKAVDQFKTIEKWYKNYA